MRVCQSPDRIGTKGEHTTTRFASARRGPRPSSRITCFRHWTVLRPSVLKSSSFPFWRRRERHRQKGSLECVVTRALATAAPTPWKNAAMS